MKHYDDPYAEQLAEQWRNWFLEGFFNDHSFCPPTAMNKSLLLAGCDYTRCEVNEENLQTVYNTLLEMGVPLEVTQSRLIAGAGRFPRLLQAGLAPIYQRVPALKILADKQAAERILAEKMQREADAVDAPAVPGVWYGGAYYTDLSTIPQGPAELAGMTRANQTALDQIGQRQLSRNLAVRNRNLD